MTTDYFTARLRVDETALRVTPESTEWDRRFLTWAVRQPAGVWWDLAWQWLITVGAFPFRPGQDLHETEEVFLGVGKINGFWLGENAYVFVQLHEDSRPKLFTWEDTTHDQHHQHRQQHETT